MKKIILAIYILSILIIISCKTEPQKNKRQFIKVKKQNGNYIVRIYENKKEYDLDKNYKFYSFYSDWKLMVKTTFCNGVIDGNHYYYDSTKRIITRERYKNDLRHGISRTYNEEGQLMTEILYIDDFIVNWTAITTFKSDKIKEYRVLAVDTSNNGEDVGYYYVNNKNEIIDSLSQYYILKSDTDTIKYGDEYKIDIQLLIKRGDTTYNNKVLIGEINKYSEFIDSTSVVKLEFDNMNKVSYSTKDYKEGYNLILGKIFSTQDTTINNIKYTHESEFLLYHEFYVIK